MNYRQEGFCKGWEPVACCKRSMRVLEGECVVGPFCDSGYCGKVPKIIYCWCGHKKSKHYKNSHCKICKFRLNAW